MEPPPGTGLLVQAGQVQDKSSFRVCVGLKQPSRLSNIYNDQSTYTTRIDRDIQRLDYLTHPLNLNLY
jgi:hypothetical protein